MAQIRVSSNQGESLLNIFPNPCIGDTYLYTDDLEAAWIYIFDQSGSMMEKSPIEPGKTLHLLLSLAPGAYQLVLKDHYEHVLGLPKTLYISESY